MPVKRNHKKVVFFSAITSDIAIEMAKRYSRDGYAVAGTYRSKKLLPRLAGLPDCYLFPCDLTKVADIRKTVAHFKKLRLRWETFVSCACQANPLLGFFKSDFNEWSGSVHLNAIEQLRVLHGLYPLRDSKKICNVVLFAGPGTNNAPKNFSALTVAKLMLIKMCELLDAENDDLNVFIVGPGWTKTKAHTFVLADADVSKEKYDETLDFMLYKKGTSMEDIYDCIRWLSVQGKGVAGGRNFSVVHDFWGKEELARELLKDSQMYKLRRFRNNWKDKEGTKR